MLRAVAYLRRTAKKQYVVYKVVSIEPETGKFYSEFGKGRSFFPNSIGEELKSKAGFFVSNNRDFVLDYYLGMSDHADVVLELGISELDLLNPEDVSQLDNPSVAGDELLVTNAEIIDIHITDGDR